MRQGKPSNAPVRTGNTRVLVFMPPKAAEVQPEKPMDAFSGREHTKTLAEDMSRSLWSSLNPGYTQQEPGNLRSVASADYVWDKQEVCPQSLARNSRVSASQQTLACLQWLQERSAWTTAHLVPEHTTSRCRGVVVASRTKMSIGAGALHQAS